MLQEALPVQGSIWKSVKDISEVPLFLKRVGWAGQWDTRSPPFLITTVNIEKSTGTSSWLCSLKIFLFDSNILFLFFNHAKQLLTNELSNYIKKDEMHKTLVCPVALCFEWRRQLCASGWEGLPKLCKPEAQWKKPSPEREVGGWKRKTLRRKSGALSTGTHPRSLKWQEFQSWMISQSCWCT